MIPVLGPEVSTQAGPTLVCLEPQGRALGACLADFGLP